MRRRFKNLLAAVFIASVPIRAVAQTSGSASTRSAQTAAAVETSLATPAGNEVTFTIGGYKYVEPGDTAISIHGLKVGGGYARTLLLNPRAHWFLTAEAKGLAGNATYDGWCAPFLIVPSFGSPNGYALDLGNYSRCSERGDQDWYVEARALTGKDFIGEAWAWSPQIGLGIRHLSNGLEGVAGFRTDDYLYLPVAMTVRTRVASHHALSLTVEYDQLLHGWQTTRDSELGSGTVPATPIAPAFTIEGFSDISFNQDFGWALRGSAKYQIAGHWSVQPEYVYWHVGPSNVNAETVAFTVNRITAHQQFGAYEPLNTTNEFVVKLAFGF